MEKPASLRAALVAALPEFGEAPDRLKVFVDTGRLASRLRPALGYEYRYTLRLFFEAFTASPDSIMVPLLIWAREQQPDLFLRFGKDEEAIRFAADILDERTWDVAVTFDLTEAVRVDPDGCGGWIPVHLREANPNAALLPGTDPGDAVTRILLGDAVVAGE